MVKRKPGSPTAKISYKTGQTIGGLRDRFSGVGAKPTPLHNAYACDGLLSRALSFMLNYVGLSVFFLIGVLRTLELPLGPLCVLPFRGTMASYLLSRSPVK